MFNEFRFYMSQLNALQISIDKYMHIDIFYHLMRFKYDSFENGKMKLVQSKKLCEFAE